MLLDARLPIMIGTIFIAVLMWTLFEFSPTPGELSRVHGDLPNVQNQAGCQTCHSAEGLTAGCLDCHAEITAQVNDESGFHGVMAANDAIRCANCHQEHVGAEFSLINEISWGDLSKEEFQHAHVEFKLAGAHDELSCEECHVAKRSEGFNPTVIADRIRAHTFLGLSQDCTSCHQDPHAGGLANECDTCHGQDFFQPPAIFDHNEVFSLRGGHEQAACADCHLIPPPTTEKRAHPFPFEQVHGTSCQDCHESPHQVAFQESCKDCHQPEDGSFVQAVASMTPHRHAQTGFQLLEPHQDVDCDQCHQPDLPFAERHPDPRDPHLRREQNSCQDCHEDIHRGQFEGRHECLDCHEFDRFAPPKFDDAAHNQVFALKGVHEETDCASCHQPDHSDPFLLFAGTSQSCQQCHLDPHANQFQPELSQGDCAHCHTDQSVTFAIAPFDHKEFTGFDLVGAHSQQDCDQCHVNRRFEVAGEPVVAQRFRGTPSDCRSCHGDIHKGQFAGRYSCLDCHTPHAFQPTQLKQQDHGKFFALTGAHEATACVKCHQPSPAHGGARKFAGTTSSCKECHGDPHVGQFAEEMGQRDCTMCHNDISDTFDIRPFDHTVRTGVELQGAHVNASCQDCHVFTDFEVAGEVIPARRYKNTPSECAACHEDTHRGQFEDYESCETCHISQSTWSEYQFDHNTQSQFILEGAHLEVTCSACHQPELQDDQSIMVRYRPLGTDCRDCHEIDPRSSK